MKIGQVADPFPEENKLPKYPYNSGTANGGYIPPDKVPTPAPRSPKFIPSLDW
jgi:hypothetical protein